MGDTTISPPPSPREHAFDENREQTAENVLQNTTVLLGSFYILII